MCTYLYLIRQLIVSAVDEKVTTRLSEAQFSRDIVLLNHLLSGFAY